MRRFPEPKHVPRTFALAVLCPQGIRQHATVLSPNTADPLYLKIQIKRTLSPHKIFSYMKHMDPLSTKKPSKNSSEFLTPLKNALKVQFSVLNRAENASMAPHYHPQMRQWLQNFLTIGVNGSRFSSLSASMTPDSYPRIQ